MRPRSSLFRTLYVVTAIVTVWCLGCDALEPLIARLASRSGSAFMDCASEGVSAASVVATMNADKESAVRAPASNDQQGVACDCHSCLAPAPAVLATAPVASFPADELAERFAAPTSIDRAPLVPPPQALA